MASRSELERLHTEFNQLEDGGVELGVFKSCVQHVSPHFPSEWLHILFERLDKSPPSALHPEPKSGIADE